MGTIDDDTCWLCDTGQRQTRFHLVVRCPTLGGQQRVLWKRVEELCDWEEPRAQEVRLLFDDLRAAPAVLTFLRDTRVGRIVPQALRRRREGESGREVDREGGGTREGRAHPETVLFSSFPCPSAMCCFVFSFVFSWLFLGPFLC